MTTNGKRIGLLLLAALRHQRSGSMHSVGAIIAKGLCFGLLAASFTAPQTASADDAAKLSKSIHSLYVQAGAAAPSTIKTQPVVAHGPKRANFERERASYDARYVADWVVDSGDNRRMPFVIVDKTEAKVFVFNADGRLRGASPALLGLAIGDYAVPGIGNRKLSSIRPEERTTPAGRFVAALGRNLHGKEILWVDYDGSVSMHPVVTNRPEERRAQRLASPTTLDKRISYGCINVPAKFYKNVVHTAFTGTNGIVYVLPEIRSVAEVFASYDVEEHMRSQTASQTAPPLVASGGFIHNNPSIVGAGAEPILVFNEMQGIFSGVINNEFYNRFGNFWHISLDPNIADPGFEMMKRSNDWNSSLSQRLNRCDSVFWPGFCQTLFTRSNSRKTIINK